MIIARWKKVLLALCFVVAILLGALTWYHVRYSMDVIQPLTVPVPNAKHHVLIASQGSTYKRAVVSGILEALQDRLVAIQVIDVTGLPTINADEWNVIVILHTWEYRKPQADVQRFVDQLDEHNKLVVLSTSGEGTYKMAGIDSISSASTLIDVSENVAQIVQRVDSLLTQ